MLVCVDGTGVTDIEAYRATFEHSFVNRIKNAYVRSYPPPEPLPIHHRGPGGDAMGGSFGGSRHVSPAFVVDEIRAVLGQLNDEVDAIPSWALRQSAGTWPAEDVEALRLIEQRRKLYMTGYSRGGAIVIDVARRLNRCGVQVEAIFLFDAVSRNPALDADEIPSNVGYCYHAMRDFATSSRETFGNAGTTAASGVFFKHRHFMTTHGGMGGAPWGPGAGTSMYGTIVEGALDAATTLTPEAEAAGMEQVRQWMWPWLRQHGVVP